MIDDLKLDFEMVKNLKNVFILNMNDILNINMDMIGGKFLKFLFNKV